MKNLLYFILIFVVAACNNDDLQDDFYPELLPVDVAEFPVQFKKDSLYEIPIKYVRPTTCYVFEGFYYSKNLNVRTVAISTTVLKQNNCTTAPINPLTAILKFTPTTESSYVFKLWKGKDTAGQDTFQEVEIPVVP